MAGPAQTLVEHTVTRLKFPQAFAVFLILFILDVLIPDLVPFADEILLGLGAALFGMWREQVKPSEGPKPSMKNVTPPPS